MFNMLTFCTCSCISCTNRKAFLTESNELCFIGTYSNVSLLDPILVSSCQGDLLDSPCSSCLCLKIMKHKCYVKKAFWNIWRKSTFCKNLSNNKNKWFPWVPQFPSVSSSASVMLSILCWQNPVLVSSPRSFPRHKPQVLIFMVVEVDTKHTQSWEAWG